MQGEIVFDAGDKRYTLFLGNAAQCAVEEHFDRGFFAVVTDAMPSVDPQTAMAVAQAMSAGVEMPPDLAEKALGAMRGLRVSVLRDLAWFGLRRAHPDITLADVSDIIDQLGQERFGDIIGRAIRAAQGGGSGDDADLGKPGTLRNGQTGPRSKKRGAPQG